MVDILPVIHCYQALFNTAIVRELIAFWFSPRIYCSEVSESQSYMRLPEWNTKCIRLNKMCPSIMLQEITISLPFAFLGTGCYFLKGNTSSAKGRKAFYWKLLSTDWLVNIDQRFVEKCVSYINLIKNLIMWLHIFLT